MKYPYSSPESSSCADAARKLNDQLNPPGTSHTFIGIARAGLSSDEENMAIHVHLNKRFDRRLIPSKFNGFEVLTIHSGKVMPL